MDIESIFGFFIILIICLYAVFRIWMIIETIRFQRAGWFILIYLFPFFGEIFFYFKVYKKIKKKGQCKICKEIMATEEDLKVHMKLVHKK